jgi:hypothetical protein
MIVKKFAQRWLYGGSAALMRITALVSTVSHFRHFQNYILEDAPPPLDTPKTWRKAIRSPLIPNSKRSVLQPPSTDCSLRLQERIGN